MEWPPIPALEGYGLEPGNAILRTEMESGHARQRRLSASVPTRVPAVWKLTQADFAAFEAWYHHTLSNGVAWYSQRIKNGMGLAEVDARFIEPYKATLLGGVWSVTATLEIRNPSIMSAEALEAYLA